ncbi:MAG: T9SS type A sorting domain-containing protein [Bacteroidota bacterium]
MKHFAEIVSLKLLVIGSLFLSSFLTFSQNIPVGTWRTHFSYQQALIMEVTGDKVFCAATNGLFSVDLSDGAVRRLSKLDGLADVGVSALKYEPVRNMLVIGYQSGLVDFIFEDGVQTITDIFDSNLTGNKQINDIAVSEQETYLATDLGVVVVDNDEVRIRENYVQIGAGGAEVRINEIAFINNTLFINTSSGFQRGDLSNNLLDFNNWRRFDGTETFENLIAVASGVFALEGLNVYQLVADSWQDLSFDLPGGTRLFPSSDNLYAASPDTIYQLTDAGFETLTAITATAVNDLELVNGAIWLADDALGLLDENGTALSPEGPISDRFSRIKTLDGSVYGFHAPQANDYDGTQKMDGYSLFSNGRWSIEELSGFQNVADVGVFGSERYFASIGDGIYRESSGEILSDIPSSAAPLDTMITAIAAGSDELWVCSFGTSQPVARLNNEGWQAFSGLAGFTQFTDVAISQTGVLWLSGTPEGIVNFDAEEPRVQLINASSGIPGTVSDVEISIQDNVWVSTLSGPVSFTDASFIFDFNEAFLPVFENQTLFEEEPIHSIQTDGGNRVWFATSRGLWLFDADITEQVFLFTQDNSPLPSNEILDLTYNGVNGELFALTDKGLVSFRSASSIGTLTHSNVNVFPNPVTPEYQGMVGISGLAVDATIKVTDINGVLVQELQANGGSAAWNLTNVLNKQVSTGIYLLFSSTSDGEETFVGKIAVIR